MFKNIFLKTLALLPLVLAAILLTQFDNLIPLRDTYERTSATIISIEDTVAKPLSQRIIMMRLPTGKVFWAETNYGKIGDTVQLHVYKRAISNKVTYKLQEPAPNNS